MGDPRDLPSGLWRLPAAMLAAGARTQITASRQGFRKGASYRRRIRKPKRKLFEVAARYHLRCGDMSKEWHSTNN